jgi:hypothetical protein
MIGYYNNDKNLCSSCESIIDGCIECDSSTGQVICSSCNSERNLNNNSCESKGANAIIIVASVVGGVVLLGGGMFLFM